MIEMDEALEDMKRACAVEDYKLLARLVSEYANEFKPKCGECGENKLRRIAQYWYCDGCKRYMKRDFEPEPELEVGEDEAPLPVKKKLKCIFFTGNIVNTEESINKWMGKTERL